MRVFCVWYGGGTIPTAYHTLNEGLDCEVLPIYLGTVSMVRFFIFVLPNILFGSECCAFGCKTDYGGVPL